MTNKTTQQKRYTAVVYECGCISWSNISTGYKPGHFCSDCGAPSERYFSERDSHALSNVVMAYCDGDMSVGTGYK